MEERNELGTFIAFAFAGTLGACNGWVRRATERGYGLRPNIGTASERIRAARAGVTS